MRLFLASAVLAPLLLVLGCSSLLPTVKETTRARWETFEEMKKTYEQVVPYETSTEELRQLGFDPFSTANVKILTYLNVTQRFLPNPSVEKEDLPPGVQECLEAQGKCNAYELDVVNLRSKRHGNVFFDLFNFRRKTHRSGWTFKALFVVVDGAVVYKLWSGNPIIDETTDKKNPLGPLQNAEDILRATVGR